MSRVFHLARLAGGGIAAVVFAAALNSTAFANAETEAAQARVKQLGKRWDPEVNTETRAAYLPALRVARRDGVTVHRDLKYGADERHRLDVFEPVVKAARPMPVVVYVHGGGLTGGDKDAVGTPFEGYLYGNVGRYFALNGMVGVNATYRLVPQVKFPGGAEDVAGVVRWVRANAARYGGDPNQITLIGHSAGGTIVGGYLYKQDVQPSGDPGIAAAILLSPAVGGERTGPREKIALDYYGPDRAKWVENVPLGLYNTYQGRRVPTMVVVAEYDPPEIEAPAAALIARICEKEQACPHFVNMRGHNHVSHAMSLTTADNSFGTVVLDFVRRTLANRK